MYVVDDSLLWTIVLQSGERFCDRNTPGILPLQKMLLKEMSCYVPKTCCDLLARSVKCVGKYFMQEVTVKSAYVAHQAGA